MLTMAGKTPGLHEIVTALKELDLSSDLFLCNDRSVSAVPIGGPVLVSCRKTDDSLERTKSLRSGIEEIFDSLYNLEILPTANAFVRGANLWTTPYFNLGRQNPYYVRVPIQFYRI